MRSPNGNRSSGDGNTNLFSARSSFDSDRPDQRKLSFEWADDDSNRSSATVIDDGVPVPHERQRSPPD
jgi:hypothetical protein